MALNMDLINKTAQGAVGNKYQLVQTTPTPLKVDMAKVKAAAAVYSPVKLSTATPSATVTAPNLTTPPLTNPLLSLPSDVVKYGKGNVDLTNRPKVRNADGSISTVRSMSFGEDGKEILVPTVSHDGRIMSDDEAIDYYHSTGEYLGKFDTIDEVNKYAEWLHNQQAAKLPKPLTLAKPSEVAAALKPVETKQDTKPTLSQLAKNFGYGFERSAAAVAAVVIRQQKPQNPHTAALRNRSCTGWLKKA